MKNSYIFLALCLNALLPVELSQAASGQIQARLVISASCEVNSGISSSVGDIDGFGMLDFGVQGPIWNERINADLAGVSTNTLSVTCNPSVTGFIVTIDGGANGDGSNRRLSNGARMIPYKLYFDAARQNDYSIGQRHNFAVNTGVQVSIPVYGAVEANPSALPEGVYLDTLMVTLDW